MKQNKKNTELTADEMAVLIVSILKTMKPETRDEWKRQCLEKVPDSKRFVEAALAVVSDNHAAETVQIRF